MKKIGILLVILIVILYGLSFCWRNKISKTEGIEINFKGEKFNINDFSNFTFETIKTNRGDEYSGFSINEIFNFLEIDPKDINEVRFSSKDGAYISFSKEMFSSIYLTFQEKDKFFRLIIPIDKYGERWLKYITTIEIK